MDCYVISWSFQELELQRLAVYSLAIWNEPSNIPLTIQRCDLQRMAVTYFQDLVITGFYTELASPTIAVLDRVDVTEHELE